MSDDMLQDILAIERQIEADLQAERARAQNWLAREKAAIDREAERQLEQKVSTVTQNSEYRCQSARDAGAARIRQMRRYVRRLQAVADATLEQMVQRHLAPVVGEGCHDYPDGEN